MSWARAMVASIHGGPDEPELTSGCDFDGGVRTDGMPRGNPRPLPLSGEPRELGWGHSVELEDGAKLLFRWLAREDRL